LACGKVKELAARKDRELAPGLACVLGWALAGKLAVGWAVELGGKLAAGWVEEMVRALALGLGGVLELVSVAQSEGGSAQA
jgi:hypothetical protein